MPRRVIPNWRGKTEFSRIMFEQQIESNPEKAQHYQVQRNFLNNVGRKQGRNMNNRTRQKLEKRQQEGQPSSKLKLYTRGLIDTT